MAKRLKIGHKVAARDDPTLRGELISIGPVVSRVMVDGKRRSIRTDRLVRTGSLHGPEIMREDKRIKRLALSLGFTPEEVRDILKE